MQMDWIQQEIIKINQKDATIYCQKKDTIHNDR